MTSTQKSLVRFATDHKLVVEFYSDKYGSSLRARYTDDDNVERGTVVRIGTGGGSLQAIGQATEEAIQTLLNAAT